jgi:hypothetical protein
MLRRFQAIRSSVKYIGLWKTFFRFLPSRFFSSSNYKAYCRRCYVESCCHEIINESLDFDWSGKVVNRNIFVFWFQGFDAAPETVRQTFNSLKSTHGDSFDVIFVDKFNVGDFCEDSQANVGMVESGLLHPAHFSDILRFSLIYKHGGVWLDAGMYYLDDIGEMLKGRLRSLQVLDSQSSSVYVSKGRWAGAVWGGLKGDPFFLSVTKCLNLLHAISGPSIEFLIMDDVLDLIISRSNSIASQLTDSPSVRNLYSLQRSIIQNCCSGQVVAQNPIGKLTHKYDDLNSEFFSLIMK